LKKGQNVKGSKNKQCHIEALKRSASDRLSARIAFPEGI
jgi:hypothetical protein